MYLEMLVGAIPNSSAISFPSLLKKCYDIAILTTNTFPYQFFIKK